MIGWVPPAAAATPELAFAARTRPAGAAVLAAVFAEAREGGSDRTEVGASFDTYFLWFEPAVRVRETVAGGLLVATGGVGAEPGAYVRDDARDAPRAFAVRPIGRAQLELNLRNDVFWLYGRAAGLARHHPFPEWDPFRYQPFRGAEGTLEHAVAAMVSPSGAAERKLWFYAEYIGQDSVGIGVVDRNVRLGVVGERLTRHLALDVDGYWSFMDNGLGGPGLLGIVFWRG